ncbi:hypothetical protein PoB_000488500 [Plakobranchus ocellatus]|uniref:Uncharacterized protein n=1 Tax=Plakobranchus ocellatus TaxID=259542 RepID=A0AAV3Y5K7_9GAST|nr:hypothetical protein PoB_000488500 [Plakobranchus ocellatus]
MATSNDLLIKQRSVIEFLAAEGCSAANIQLISLQDSPPAMEPSLEIHFTELQPWLHRRSVKMTSRSSSKNQVFLWCSGINGDPVTCVFSQKLRSHAQPLP